MCNHIIPILKITLASSGTASSQSPGLQGQWVCPIHLWFLFFKTAASGRNLQDLWASPFLKTLQQAKFALCIPWKWLFDACSVNLTILMG